MTNHEGHKILWDKLAKTGSLDKDGTFNRLFPDEKDSAADEAACFACKEADERDTGDGACNHCPIDWGDGMCLDQGSLYRNWRHTGLAKERKAIAAKIRDLPWKEVENNAQ